MTKQRRTEKILLSILLTAFSLLGSLYSFTTPIWEAPDEPAHYSYIAFLLEEHRIPRSANESLEFRQPPLYYLLAALTASPFRDHAQVVDCSPNPEFYWASGKEPNACQPIAGCSWDTFRIIYLLRLFSTALGALTVWLTVKIGWECFPERREVGLLAGSLVAFNPQFLFIHGAVNNDSLCALLATSTIYFFLKTSRKRNPRQLAALCLCCLLGPFSKFYILPVTLVSSLGFLVPLARTFCKSERQSSTFASLLLGFIGGGLAILGHVQGLFRPGFGIWLNATWPLKKLILWNLLTTQFRSFWGLFGWMTIPAPDWFYSFIILLGLIALAGLVKVQQKRLSRFQCRAMAYQALFVCTQELSMILLMSGEQQGRRLFVIIAPLAVLLGLGLSHWVKRYFWLVACILFFIAFYMPIGVIRPGLY